MEIIKYVDPTGSGDYLDLITGISGVINLANDANEYSDIYLYVSRGIYSGSFNINIPYSGSLSIIGNDSVFYPTTTCYIYGNYYNKENFIINGFNIYGKYNSNTCFSLSSGLYSTINNAKVVHNNFINNSGVLSIYDSKITGSGYGVISDGSVYFIRSSISNYNIGITSNDISIYDSFISYCDSGVFNIGNINIFNTVINKCHTGIYNIGTVELHNTTLYNTYDIYSVSGIVSSESSIANIFGISNSGFFNNHNFYSGYQASVFSFTDSNNISEHTPIYNSIQNDDYRLVFNSTSGSYLVNFSNKIDSDINVINDIENIKLIEYFDTVNYNIPIEQYSNFIYKNDSTMILSDYGKEIQFSNFIQSKEILLNTISIFKFSNYNVYTDSSFPIELDKIAYTWDWDFKNIATYKIGNDYNFIIPRSIVNVKNIIDEKIPNYKIRYDLLNKNSYNVYNQIFYTGISYDDNLSTLQDKIIWLVDGNNQTLLKKNIYNDEIYDSYPLMIPSGTYYVNPSGLIYVGRENEKYKYVYEADPSKYIYTDNYNGRFQLLPTNINNNIDIRGIRNYYDKLLITGSEYSMNINNRLIPSSGNCVGKMYMLNNNDDFLHYIYEPNNSFILENNIPTDLTVDEFNNIVISDYYDSNLYKYKFLYDYAVIESNYDQDIKVLLREYYPNIEL